QLNDLLLRPDTRNVAARWVADNVAQGSPIAEIDHTTPYGKPPIRESHSIVPFGNPPVLKAKGIFWVLSDSNPFLAHYSPGPSDLQRSMLQSDATLVFDLNPLAEGASDAVYDPNDAFYAPLRHISSMETPGPRIRIWKLN